MNVTSALRARIGDPRRIDDYYAPLAEHVAARLAAHPRRPLVVGVQGPQGCGKSTLTGVLVAAFGDAGVASVGVSIDDFYLTRPEQEALAARHLGDRSLEHRGSPGTHDVPLGRAVLAALMVCSSGAVRVPVYDKSAHGGRGDRAPEARWRAVERPLDLVVVEGWMLGFRPAPEPGLDPRLAAPNRYLEGYLDWPTKLDLLIHLDVPSPDAIVAFRVDAERARRAKGEAALSDADARDYIERFLPAYETYVPRLRRAPPCDDFLHVVLGDDRMPRTPLALNRGPLPATPSH